MFKEAAQMLTRLIYITLLHLRGDKGRGGALTLDCRLRVFLRALTWKSRVDQSIIFRLVKNLCQTNCIAIVGQRVVIDIDDMTRYIVAF